jgi:hypothetical protein
MLKTFRSGPAIPGHQSAQFFPLPRIAAAKILSMLDFNLVQVAPHVRRVD